MIKHEQQKSFNKIMILKAYKLIGICSCWMIALFGLTLNIHAEETILNVDFGQDLKLVSVNAKGSFNGLLPSGCNPDFPAWNQSVASSQQLNENGRKFLRFKVDKFDKGVMLSFIKQNFSPGSYRLTLTCRLFEQDLRIGIRQLPKPYTMYWSGNIAADRQDWQGKSFLITFTDKKLAPGVFLYLPAGECDIASLKLVKLDAVDLVNFVSRPSIECRNFFRNSRFPLGLQAGWNPSRDFTGGRIEADATVLGPSGYSALKLQSDAPLTLFSEPFQTSAPLTENHVSLAIKGSGQWTVSVHSSYSDAPHW